MTVLMVSEWRVGEDGCQLTLRTADSESRSSVSPLTEAASRRAAAFFLSMAEVSFPEAD